MISECFQVKCDKSDTSGDICCTIYLPHTATIPVHIPETSFLQWISTCTMKASSQSGVRTVVTLLLLEFYLSYVESVQIGKD